MNDIYCADMTMLIGAASRFRRAGRSNFTLIDPYEKSDPEASQCFEWLATIVCNDTRVYFEEPEDLDFNPPIIAAWKEAAGESNIPPRGVSRLSTVKSSSE